MINTDKLLRALIDALGFEVETARTKKGQPYASLASSPAGVDVHKFVDGLFYEYDVDCKVTKKASTVIKCTKCGTHLGKGAPLDSCICGNSDNLVGKIQ